MKYLAALLGSLLLCSSARAEECTFDVKQTQLFEARVAALHPGRRPAAGGGYTWDLPGGISETFQYGGCMDLGSVVTRTDRAAAPLTLKEVQRAARALARKYWVPRIVKTNAAQMLATALERHEYETVQQPDGAFELHLRPKGSTLADLAVTYAYVNGQGTLTVSYQEGR